MLYGQCVTSAYGVTDAWFRQIFRIGTVRYAESLWRMRRHGPVIAHCTDSEDFPTRNLHANIKGYRPSLYYLIIAVSRNLILPNNCAVVSELLWLANYGTKTTHLPHIFWKLTCYFRRWVPICWCSRVYMTILIFILRLTGQWPRPLAIAQPQQTYSAPLIIHSK